MVCIYTGLLMLGLIKNLSACTLEEFFLVDNQNSQQYKSSTWNEISLYPCRSGSLALEQSGLSNPLIIGSVHLVSTALYCLEYVYLWYGLYHDVHTTSRNHHTLRTMWCQGEVYQYIRTLGWLNVSHANQQASCTPSTNSVPCHKPEFFPINFKMGSLFWYGKKLSLTCHGPNLQG